MSLPPPPAKLTAIEISAIPELIAGTTQQLTATGLFDDGSRINITNQVNWLSKNPDILTISTTGLLTTITAGSTTVQAELFGVTIEMSVSVLRGNKPPSITGTPPAASVGLPFQFKPTLYGS